MKERPHRQYELTIRVSADDWQEMERALRSVTDHVLDHGTACESVCGGPNSGHIVDIRHDPAMTHERWEQELEAYLAERDAEKVSQG